MFGRQHRHSKLNTAFNHVRIAYIAEWGLQYHCRCQNSIVKKFVVMNLFLCVEFQYKIWWLYFWKRSWTFTGATSVEICWLCGPGVYSTTLGISKTTPILNTWIQRERFSHNCMNKRYNCMNKRYNCKEINKRHNSWTKDTIFSFEMNQGYKLSLWMSGPIDSS